MEVKDFENGIGIPIEEFLDIITNGFYYIETDKNGRKEIYWLGNRCVFIGNGYCPHSNNMVKTNFLYKKNSDAHYWDWLEENSVFNFENYNKTWSIHREILEEIIENE